MVGVSSNEACSVPPFEKGGLGGISSILSLLLIAVLCLSMTACGWRLRGSMNLDVSLPPMQLQFQQASANLRRELTQTLESTGVELRNDADLVLLIHRENQGRRVLSVDSNGKVSEYELQYELLFSLSEKGGETLIDNEHISQQRDYQFDEAAVLAKSEEERRLFDFMRGMSIQSLVRQVSTAVANKTVTPAPAPAPESIPSTNAD